MNYFEAYPWLLIPLIILTVEGWALVKKAAVEVAKLLRPNIG